MRRGWPIGLILVLAACGFLAPTPAPRVPEFKPLVPMEGPDGPILVLGGGRLAGGRWEVVAYRSRDGSLCSHRAYSDGSGGGGCGASIGERTVFGPISTAPTGVNDRILVDALLSGAVQRVRIESSDGTHDVEPRSLAAIGFDLVGFAVILPPGAKPTALVALDGSGATLDRFPLEPIAPPPGAPDVVPTPAAS